MIVTATNTEIKLKGDLHRYAAEYPEQYCFFLEFSKTDILKKVLFETVLRTFEKVPRSHMAKVYFCHDKDILILMDGIVKQHFHEFVQNLTNELWQDNLNDIVHIFEIGRQWYKIEALYKKKINMARWIDEQHNTYCSKKTPDEITSDILLKLDPDLLSNINKRRVSRAHPLVLIADDDQVSRVLSGKVLEIDYDVAYAKNGSEALKQYVTLAPDMLYLDIGMPDINGHDVLRSLFHIDPDAFIIMFSGRKDKTTIMKSLEMGAQGFLGKPFTRDQLRAHVKSSPFVEMKQIVAA